MKKAMALFCLVFVLAVGVCTFEFFKINGQKENIGFTVMSEQGDKRYADGLNVQLVSQHMDRLTWKTDYTFGQTDEIKTEFEFHKKYLNKDIQTSRYFDIYSGYSNRSFSSSGSGIIIPNSVGINKAYLELAEEAQPGATAKKTIYLKDYYEYYPIRIDVHLDNYGLDETAVLPGETENHYTDEEKSIIKRLNEFLRIPVLEDEKLTISLTKSASGDIYETGYCNDDFENSYSMGVINAVSKDTVYFVTSIRTESGRKVDTSLIPGGYGIYAFDYALEPKTDDERNNFYGDYYSNTASFGEIKNIYPLNEDCEITSLFLSMDESTLNILTNENGKSYLTAIDAKTHECRQKLQIADMKISCWDVRNCDDYTVVPCIADDDEYLIVLTIGKNDEYKLEYMVKCSYLSISDSYLYYENGLLYVANNIIEADGMYACGFSVSVYSKDGLKYHGEYLSSLSTGSANGELSTYDICLYVEEVKYHT